MIKDVKVDCRYCEEIGCKKHGKYICKQCKDYISKYAKTDCKHYRANESKLTMQCSVLKCTSKGAPCANPRIKKNGRPGCCTFYERKNDGK